MVADSAGGALDIREATKIFTPPGAAPVEALRRVSLTVADGEFVTIVGPSGCGKSTLLAAVAGLTTLTSGTITVGGREVRGPGRDRSVVFQQASLLPWRTVRKNIAYGMELQRAVRSAERSRRVDWALDLVGLSEFADRYPGQLSGGMQQRVNLARALATGPGVLLMDEPFGALDAMTKSRLQAEVSRISMETHATVLFVTHDIDEALRLADRVVIMSRRPGRIAQIFEVPEQRPRSEEFLETKVFARLRRELRLSIEDTLDEAATGAAGPAAARGPDAGPPRQAGPAGRAEPADRSRARR